MLQRKKSNKDSVAFWYLNKTIKQVQMWWKKKKKKDSLHFSKQKMRKYF